MPYCVLKRKKVIPDSQNIFNKHFREFPPPLETLNYIVVKTSYLNNVGPNYFLKSPRILTY